MLKKTFTVTIPFLFFLAAFDSISWTPAAESLPLATLVRDLSLFQHRGGWFRDRCTYFQKISVERYKKRSDDGTFQKLFSRRQSVAEISADKKGEVISRLLSDTDGNLKPKKVKSSSRTVWGAPAFLELIFFPLYPEKVAFYLITDLGTTVMDDRSVRILRIYPKEGQSEPLVEGVFYLDPETGRPLRLQVNRLHNFVKLDKSLKNLLEFQYDLNFRTLPNGVTVPYKITGKGYSKIRRYNGYFNFIFEEWGYHPNPLYPDVDTWFEKMKDFTDDPPNGAPLDLLKDEKSPNQTQSKDQTESASSL